MDDNRQNIRYSEIGPVFAPEICALSGVLDDISTNGCRLHFPVPVVVDLEKEYLIKIQFSRLFGEEPLQLMCKPMWISEKEGTTQIGFTILFSPDEMRFQEYITHLDKLNEDNMPEIE